MIGRLLRSGSSRCIVIALDGVAWSAWTEWGDEVMPTIAAMGRRGAVRRLASPLPALSAVAWSSFATASNPGRHGVFGFTLPDEAYHVTFASSESVKMPTLWDRAAIDGRRSVVVNLPGTYPARPMSGSLVAGFVAPDLGRACHPPSLAPRLERMDYRLDVDVRVAEGDEAAFLASVEHATARRVEAMRWLLDTERWSLAILAFTEPDRLLHALNPTPLEDSASGAAYRRLLARIDAFAGDLLTRFADATILVVSDHGFAPLEQYFNLTAWLRERGHLVADELDDVDERSIAFALDPGRIYVNASERFARGSVPPDDVRRVSEQLAAELLDVRAPDGSRPIASVRHRRDIYTGPHTRSGPNIIGIAAPGWELKASMRMPMVSRAERLHGTHTHDDALLVASHAAHGSGSAASLEDVGGLVLATLGVHADDVDGRLA